MRIKFLFILLLVGYSVASSASYVFESSSATRDSTTVISTYKPTVTKKAKRMGFFQRMALKMVMKRYGKHYGLVGPEKADQLASTSMWLGILALVFAVIPWYTILAAIPLGIVAMILGNRAIESGATKISRAKVGKGLGLAALILVAVWIVVGLIAWASFLSAFN